MTKVVIFGVKDFASLAHFYLKRDSTFEVVGFSVNREYLPVDRTFEGLPVVPFEEVEQTYSPREYSFFAPLSPRRMNRLREQVYLQIKAKSYPVISYVSSRATVFMPELVGENCFILEDSTIQPFTSIGNNVVIWSGSQISHHGQIKDHVTLTSHVVLSGHCVVEPYCFFGANATVRDGLHVAEGTFVAMAAALTRDTEPWGVYKGNPAQKSGIPSKDLDF
jgi:sugar O-acyltransferase (sialic acid O-acetyltransferase NeuD family)